MTAFVTALSASVVAALLAVTGTYHALNRGALRRALRAHGVVPGAAVRPLALLLPAAELAIAATAVASIAGGGRTTTLVAMGAAGGLGAGLATYVRVAASATSPLAPCGCSPVEGPIASPVATVPAVALLWAGILGAAGTLASPRVVPLGAHPDLGAAAVLPVLAGATFAVVVLVLPGAVGRPAPAPAR